VKLSPAASAVFQAAIFPWYLMTVPGFWLPLSAVSPVVELSCSVPWPPVSVKSISMVSVLPTGSSGSLTLTALPFAVEKVMPLSSLMVGSAGSELTGGLLARLSMKSAAMVWSP